MPLRELRKWPAVVIGGANIDLKCQTAGPPIAGTSNPGSSRMSLGGVGRNVAENLARLGVPTTLVTAIGNDAGGDQLITETSSVGVDMGNALRTSRPTGSYTSILGPDGDMIIAVAAMEAMEQLGAGAIEERAWLIARAEILVLDCNVPEGALLRAAKIARDNDVPVVIDPVSVPKAARINSVLNAGMPIHTVTPNLGELCALTNREYTAQNKLGAAAMILHDKGVANVWVRLGVRGSFLSCIRNGVVTAEYAEPFPAAPVDATGAGDAMLAAYVSALLGGRSATTAASFGRAAAALTVECERTVNPAMTFELVQKRAAEQSAGKFRS